MVKLPRTVLDLYGFKICSKEHRCVCSRQELIKEFLSAGYGKEKAKKWIEYNLYCGYLDEIPDQEDELGNPMITSECWRVLND